MKLFAGLGNPGREYESTRHNVGFCAIEILSEKLGIPVIKSKHRALMGDGLFRNEKVILVKPMTYMNLSGESIGEIARFYKIPPEDITVIYDDVNLPEGVLRVREKGSDGGHNGMKSIIAHLGSEDFPRIRIGVGQKPKEWDLADYVLSKFLPEERELIQKAVEDAADCAKMMVTRPVQDAMNKYNKRPKKPKAEKEDGLETRDQRLETRD